MRIFSQSIIALIFGLSLTQENFAEDVHVITERTPITSSEESTIGGGEATEFVRAVLDQAGLNYDISYQPWRRAYNTARTKKNTLVYPLARSEMRENKFNWIGELIPVNYYLMKLKSNNEVKIEKLEDAKKFRIGVVNFHVSHEYLTENGFRNLQPVNNNFQNLKKIQLDRIDLFPISDGGLLQLCKRHELDCSQFEPVLKLDKISNGLYIALSNNSDLALLKRIETSFTKLVESGAHNRLFKERIEDIRRYNEIWSQ